MRQIKRSSKFKKDFKKVKLSEKNLTLLKNIVEHIAKGERLDEKFFDHPLVGNWNGYRELHLKSDCLLVYKATKNELRLARLGSHSQVFKYFNSTTTG